MDVLGFSERKNMEKHCIHRSCFLRMSSAWPIPPKLERFLFEEQEKKKKEKKHKDLKEPRVVETPVAKGRWVYGRLSTMWGEHRELVICS